MKKGLFRKGKQLRSVLSHPSLLRTTAISLVTVAAISLMAVSLFSSVAEAAFTCGTDTVQDADGNSYDTVLIGTQCWMASNLNVGTRVNGTTEMTDNATIEKYCYDDSDANCTTYGGLYQWDEAMGYVTTEGAQGICPAGWHIPTDAEQHILDNYLATGACDQNRYDWGCDPAGTALKNGGSSGFSALLAGYRYTDGSFGNLGSHTDLWSGSQSGGDAFRRHLNSGNATVHRYASNKQYGFSIRCLSDTASTAGGNTEWHHVVITDTTGVNASNFTIGEAGGGYFDGRLDEVQLYTNVVNTNEIPWLYKKGVTTIKNSL
jgi:uncharacterized protein (TIGR02145 family)